MARILPVRHQPALPIDRLIRPDAPGAGGDRDGRRDRGCRAGRAGCAIELARLVKKDQEAGGGMADLNIGVLEKAGALGEHCLSGAVVNPRAFQELFPDKKLEDFPFRQPVSGEAVYFLIEGGALQLPTPPTMRNHGYYTASLCGDGALAGRARPRRSGSTSSRASRWTRCWSTAGGCAGCGRRRRASTGRASRPTATPSRPT